MPANTMTPGEGFDLDDPNQQDKQDGPVECLGLTFANDAERREYYLAILAEKLKDPEFRKIEGFPIGEDEAILELSDPPYYTACPNPFLKDVINYFGTTYESAPEYTKEPFATNVSVGKNHPIYSAHSYHTKVPHEAIVEYIRHYTKPDDIVLDGFSGSGMTGLAASIEGRFCLLNDLSTLSGHISYNVNNPLPAGRLQKIYDTYLKDGFELLEQEFYGLNEDEVTNYVIWSDCYQCKECAHQYSYWDAAVNQDEGEAKKKFPCPSCGVEQNTRSLDRAYETKLDQLLGEPIKLFKQVPVRLSLIDSRHKKIQRDLTGSEFYFFSGCDISSESRKVFPVSRFFQGDRWRRDALDSKGITHVHHFYTERAIEVLSRIYHAIDTCDISHREKSALKFVFTSFADRNATKRNRFVINKHNPRGRVNGPMTNSLYAPNLFCEMNLFILFREKLKDIASGFLSIQGVGKRSFIQNSSSSNMSLVPNGSIDYIFTDPPFGHNIQYSELNLPLESFLKVRSSGGDDIVVNEVVGKDYYSYTKAISKVFKEYFRVLKPSRWMTVEFHNSKASVWNAIQEAIGSSGFVIANVTTLDKKQKTIHQDFNVGGTVDKDLIISAYKPSDEVQQQLKDNCFDIWGFLRSHLNNLPVISRSEGELEVTQPRLPRSLYDVLIAFSIQHDIPISLSFRDLLDGVSERFSERDGMVFLPEQVVEYDKARISSKQLRQMTIFVDNEASAIEWLRQIINDKPQTYQDVHPKFINELTGWKAAEEQLELSKLLEQNFLNYDGVGPIPPQIHSYLSTNFKEMRNLAKNDQQLIKKAKDRWYVPNPEREEDLQKLRDRDLLKQFSEYKAHTGRKLKTVRLEAVRCGFKKAWQERDYKTIINVAEKIPQDLLQEDQKLLMWYDQAQTRASDESLF